jgi:hypothetical protein
MIESKTCPHDSCHTQVPFPATTARKTHSEPSPVSSLDFVGISNIVTTYFHLRGFGVAS